MYSLIALPATETTRSGRGCRRPTRRCSSTRRPSSRWLYYVTKRPAAGCSVQRRAVGLAIAASQATTPGGGTWNAGQGRWKNRGVRCGARALALRGGGHKQEQLGVGSGRWPLGDGWRWQNSRGEWRRDARPGDMAGLPSCWRIWNAGAGGPRRGCPVAPDGRI
jgi:hypothetical protein